MAKAGNLPRCFSFEALQKTWRESRDSNPSTSGAAGIDRISAEHFASNLNLNLKEVQIELREGRFAFRQLRVAPVPKPSGGDRIIAIPTVRDRLVQRCLLRHLENVPGSRFRSEISYGFSKGRNLQDAQARALQLRERYPWVLQADIVKFFDNVDRAQVSQVVVRRVRSTRVRDLLLSAIKLELDESNLKGMLIARENGIRRGVGLRQGMPVSPMLSNMLLRDFDNEIVRRGIQAIRYADDIALFASSRKECEAHLILLSGALAKLKLSIPELAEGGKTKLADPQAPIEFLGVEIKRHGEGYRLFAPSKKLEKVERRLAEICTVEYCVENTQTLARVLRSIESILVGYRHALANVSDRDQFEARLRAIAERQIEALLISIFGRNILRQLTAEKRAILGIGVFP
ncbi:MAG: hypothetical protein JNM47_15060 [Hyphomonadaceae bacterium]|nr:hypothetical protein [Hyphomonadaceae bacterium]